MVTIGLESEPWVAGDAIAHQEFSVRWRDSVDAEGDPHGGHSDRVVISDDAERVVLEGWSTADAMPDGGVVELEYKIPYPGLREGLYTAIVEVDADGKAAAARGESRSP